MECEVMEFDVVIVGGGLVGLVLVIWLKQLVVEKGMEIGVCLIEKGVEIGVYIFFGVVMDLCVLIEFLFNWQIDGVLFYVLVFEDCFFIFFENGVIRILNSLLFQCFYNEGNYVILFGNVCCWFGEQVEVLGVEIYFGFVGVEVLFDENDVVKGVVIGDMGCLYDGSEGLNFQFGMELYVKYIFFVEGCCGYFVK